MSEFFDTFNAALPEMEGNFTEDWTLGSSTFPAIAIEEATAGSKIMSGGKILDVHTRLFIREDVFNASGVKKGSIIGARGLQLAVLEIATEGDLSRTLSCGPAQIEVW